ncbi:hypothetical protein [Lactiplantibacillus plantarum]|uniref:hypothetical protein n=1 Tax=Lactiplantibacillus plantarum TaxID=1590 RepID=UPI0021A467D1|nr:hypothetical protein [Lactiplantibacillus plantarum]
MFAGLTNLIQLVQGFIAQVGTAGTDIINAVSTGLNIPIEIAKFILNLLGIA